jgi:hypothetical protein
VQNKRRALADLQSGRASYDLRVVCDLWCAAFFAPRYKRPEYVGRDMVPTTDTVWSYFRAPSSVYGPLIGAVESLQSHLRFFHWPLEYPDAFAAGGFDCILGNPPWEVLQFSEDEFFEARNREIVVLPGARRKNAIASLERDDPALWAEFNNQFRSVEAINHFVRNSGQFPSTSRGKLNTYALFSEISLRLVRKSGMAGLIVPTGIATDDSNKTFFAQMMRVRRLSCLTSFENEEFIFPDVHHSFKFCLLTVGYSDRNARFTFFLRNTTALTDERRHFDLTYDDLELINPNTCNCPSFRSSADADITKRIFSRVPVLINDTTGVEGNPWNISFRQGLFNMTSESRFFRTARELQSQDADRAGTNWVLGDGSRWLPLYEAKMVQHFDHRASSYESRGDERGFRILPETTLSQHIDPEFEPMPFYWVPEREVDLRLRDKSWDRSWLIGWRDITNAASERTLIPALLPRVGCGDTLLLLMPGQGTLRHYVALYGCLASLVVDFVARQKMGYLHLKYNVFKQLPVLPPAVYSASILDFLSERVIHLVYTSCEMRHFASDMGYSGPPFGWDVDRRAHLRAELDAAYAHLYGVTRDELRYILDPSDIYGSGFPSETFRVLKEKEIRQYGEYRTARLVLAAWDRMTADGTFAGWADGR